MHTSSRNLFELFVFETSGLASCVDQLNQTVEPMLHSQRHPSVHRLLTRLLQVNHHNEAGFREAVRDEGLVLASFSDATTESMLESLTADFECAQAEPESVACTRILSTLRHLALYLQTLLSNVAESAHLIGATKLQLVLRRWNLACHVYHAELCQHSAIFRFNAYAADIDTRAPNKRGSALTAHSL